MITSPRPRLLLVGGASPLPSSVDIVGRVLAEAEARGIRTHLINREPELSRTAEVTARADAVSEVDPDDPRACVAWVRDRMAHCEHFDVVLGLRDSVQHATAAVAAAVGAPGNPVGAVRLVRNKDECRAALAAAGFRQPVVWLCATEEEAAGVLRTTAGPWVVKPRDAAGSVGVRKVCSAGELTEAVAGLPGPGSFLVEEFVEGDEFSVEGVFLGGEPVVLAVTAKETSAPPYFVEEGHVLPAELDEQTRREVEHQVSAALRAVGLVFGVFHVELWLTGRGLVLGEIHPRPGGDWLHLLLTHVLPGLELFGSIFDDLLGRPVALPRSARAAAARFLTAPPGELLGVDGWSQVTRHPAVLLADLLVEPGGTVGPLRDSGDRVGVLAVGAPDAAAARRLGLALAGAVSFRVRPDRDPVATR